jgi:hypothetical protein
MAELNIENPRTRSVFRHEAIEGGIQKWSKNRNMGP